MHRFEKRVLLPEDLKPIGSLGDYKRRGGLSGLDKARAMTPQQIIDEVKKANLRGRGGAGFPAAIKWQTVKDAPDEKKYLVCNFAEGEPGTCKDRYLISKNPYNLFEGLLIVSRAINARQAIIGTKKKFKSTLEILYRAAAEFEKAGLCDKDFLRIVEGPDEYLLGEEKGLLETVDGRAPMPRFFPPFMVGVGAGPTETNPTVVNNAETLSHVPNILRNGADWFKSMGTVDTPGTIIMTLSGDIKNPGMYELQPGITVKELLYDLGGGPIGDKPLRAVFSGFSNRVLTPEHFHLKMDFGTLRAAGFGLGSCGFIVYDESRCMVEMAWIISKFLSIASCGQCIPCNMGTRVITEHLDNLEFGAGSQDDIDKIFQEAARCANQTRCFLSNQESILMPNIIKTFRKDFDHHAGSGCNYVHPIVIPKIQSFDEEKRQFILEEYPKEFLECDRYFARFAHR